MNNKDACEDINLCQHQFLTISHSSSFHMLITSLSHEHFHIFVTPYYTLNKRMLRAKSVVNLIINNMTSKLANADILNKIFNRRVLSICVTLNCSCVRNKTLLHHKQHFAFSASDISQNGYHFQDAGRQWYFGQCDKNS